MSITTVTATSAAGRVDGADWDRITEEVNSYGRALTPRLHPALLTLCRRW